MFELYVLAVSVLFFAVGNLLFDAWKERRRRRWREECALYAWRQQQRLLATRYEALLSGKE